MEIREIVETEAGIQNAGRCRQTLPNHERLTIDGLPGTQAVLSNLHTLDERDGEVNVAMEAGNILAGRQSAE